MASYALIFVSDEIAEAVRAAGHRVTTYTSLDDFWSDNPHLFTHLVLSRLAPVQHSGVQGLCFLLPQAHIICLEDRAALPWGTDAADAEVISPHEFLERLTAEGRPDESEVDRLTREALAEVDAEGSFDDELEAIEDTEAEQLVDSTLRGFAIPQEPNEAPITVAEPAVVVEDETDWTVDPDELAPIETVPAEDDATWMRDPDELPIIEATIVEDDTTWTADPDDAEVVNNDPSPNIASATLLPPAEDPVSVAPASPQEQVAAPVSFFPVVQEPTPGSSVLDFAPHQTSSRRALIITVFSSKGGVGKTTVATNLAGALANAGKSVLIADLDLADPNVGTRFGLPTPTILPLFQPGAPTLGPGNLNQFLAFSKPTNVWLANLPYLREGQSATFITPRAYAQKILTPCETLFDVIVFDCPPAYEPPLVRDMALPQADAIILVTDTELACVRGLALHQRKMQEELHIPLQKMGVVVNMDIEREGISQTEIVDVLQGVEILATLEDNRRAAVGAANKGSLLINTISPTKQKAREAFAAIVQRLFPDISVNPNVIEGHDFASSKGTGKLFKRLSGVFGRG